MRQSDQHIGKAERRVLTILLGLLIITLLGHLWSQQQDPLRAAERPDSSLATDAPHAARQRYARGSSDRQQRTGPHSDSLLTSADYVGPPQGAEATPAKYTHYVALELNQVDSLTLLRVPGIGPAFAHRILALRQRLGGYYTVLQLQEVYGMDADRFTLLRPWFVCHQGPHRQPLGTLRPDSLPWHPYLSRAQAAQLRLALLKHGRQLSWRQLRALSAFSREDSIRLSPYFPDGTSRPSAAKDSTATSLSTNPNHTK